MGLKSIFLYFIIIIFFIEIYINKSTIQRCNSINGKLLWVLHCIFGIFGHFGGYIYNNPTYNAIHLYSLIVATYVHMINGGFCPITVYNNHLCSFKEYIRVNSFPTYFVKSEKRLLVFYIVIFTAILYDLYIILS